nr:ribonuclease H-like domain-containing protein [Tanacetum cinerariifolium]
MESFGPQVMSAAKLPILNPNEFDLWKIRIEQYFLMTDYSLWEVILNGDSPTPIRVIEGVVQHVAPTTAQQRLARKNELKACGTLLMALPDKHQLKINIHKDAKTLMEAIEKRFGGNKENKKVQKTLLKQQYENFTCLSYESLDQIHDRLNKTDLEEQSLDDLFNSLKIYKAEVKSSSSASTSTQNIAFVSSNNTNITNKPVSVVASVFVASAKIHVSALPNVDTLSNDRTGRNLKANGPTFMGFDMSKVECYNYHRKGHFARECRSLKDTRRNVTAEPQRRNVLVENSTSNALVSQCDGVGSYDWSFQAEEEPTNYALMAFTSLSSSSSDNEMFTSETDESLPASPKYDRYHSGDEYHAVPPPYTGIFMPPKLDFGFHDLPNVNETVHTAFNAELSPTKPDKDLSHTHRPSAPIIEDWVSDSEDDSKAEIPHNAPTANLKSTIPKLKSHRTSRNRKACFVCKSLAYLIKDCDYYDKKVAQTPARKHAQRVNHQQYSKMTIPNPQRHLIPTAVLTESKLVLLTAARQVTTDVSPNNVTRPRPAKTVVTKPHSPPKRNINRSPSPKASTFPPKVNATKAHMGNLQHALKDKGVIDSGCSRHMIGNMSYLSNFEKINGGYVAFGGNPKGGKIYGKGKIRTGKLDFDDVYFVKELKFNRFSIPQMCNKKNSVLFTDTECIVLSLVFKLPDENQVLLRVPRENIMYNLDLKNIIPSRDLTCLFAKATLDESNLWHRRLGHINFKIMNKLGIKREFSVPRTPQQNGIAERKNRTLIEAAKLCSDSLLPILFWAEAVNTACKKLEFEGRKPESEVYVSLSSSALTKKHDDKTKREAKGKILTVGQISTNSTNTFSVVGPSNTIVSPTHGKSSYVNTSQYSNDLNMPELEDITYSNDEEDVGAEADFSNLETTITVSPISTTRVHKDHPLTQIIGDLSSATQTKSMTRVAKDQGGLSQINNDDFHTCMFACFLSQEEPNREEDIDYEEVFTPVAKIEAIRLFLAYASFMGFMVYQMDVKSAFLYRTIEEDVYVYQPLGFEDPNYSNKVYKVVKALYGLHKLLELDEKSASTPIDTEKYLLNDPDVDEKVGIEVCAIDLNVTAVRLIVTTVSSKFLLFDASEGFDQIIDFLNASSIKYTLTINPNIYVSCIKQFWSSVSVKKVNDVMRLQALVYRKKVIITEATIREALRLDDVESIDCLPNEEIFTELSRMRYEKPFTKLTFYKAFFSPQWKFFIHTILQCMSVKRTSWNEFSSSMASTVICLSTGRKFNFSKVQVGDLSSHSTKYSSLSLTQKVFANIRRVGNGISGVDTPLFEGMIVAQQDDDVADEGAASVVVDDVPAAVDEPSIPSPTPTTQPPSPSQDLPSTSQDVADVAKDVAVVKKDAEIEENVLGIKCTRHSHCQ